MNEYIQQAEKFLNDTETTFKTEFLKCGKHFQDDKEKRNIFKITLSNDKHSYSFNYGSSLADTYNFERQLKTVNAKEIKVFVGLAFSSGEKFSGSVEFKLLKENDFKLTDSEVLEYATIAHDEMKKQISDFNKTKKLIRHRYTGGAISIHDFVAHINKKVSEKLRETEEINVLKDDIEKPNSYDVLTCLTKYDPYTFEDFCCCYGYDEDSRKAYKIYESVVKEWENIEKLFDESELEQLSEIQ